MVDLTVTREINASTADVWAVLDDFGNLSWVPGTDNVEVIGEGAGMTRRLLIPGLDPIDEVLKSKDVAAKTFSYTIPKNSVIPFDDYQANVSVVSNGSNGAKVVWHCTFDEGDMAEADAEKMISGSYSMMLDALADKLGA